MRNSLLSAVLVVLAFALIASSSASAQTDVALSLYGAFSQKTTGNGVIQSPANGAGGLIELRHISNPIVGFEAAYSFNRASQRYTSQIAVTCPIGQPCPSPSVDVPANAHQVTVCWVPSVKVANLRPFGVLGVGLLLDVPKGGQSSTQTVTKPVYVYGAGLDWGLLPHLGLRLQYRGNLYNSPDLSKLFTSSKTFMHTAEHMVGIYFRL